MLNLPCKEKIIVRREQRLEVPRRTSMLGLKYGGELRFRWHEIMELSKQVGKYIMRTRVECLTKTRGLMNAH